MSLILNIDTALNTASVCLAGGDKLLQCAENNIQKEHSTWLHTAIRQIMNAEKLEMRQLNAIAVTVGPGSYTGLRVGLSAAKGLCYALNIPLIAINCLELLAAVVKEEAENIICPVIDARRMEIFYALYDKNAKEFSAPAAMILNDRSFYDSAQYFFCGNAVKKVASVVVNPTARFKEVAANATDMINLSLEKYQKKEFSNLSHTEPLYIKPFYTSSVD